MAEDWIASDVPAIVACLAGLRKQGVRAALDDFGAGQASLSHLRRLPVDMLKLDRALHWDRENECFLNDPEANRHLARTYRAPWHL